MSLVILDGHNAAFSFHVRGRTESERRKALIEHLRRRPPRASQTLWIVFDSRRDEEHHGYWLDREAYNLRVLYAPGKFDDWVVEQAESGQLQSDTVVVTDDLQLRLRLSGRVICRSLDDFFHYRR